MTEPKDHSLKVASSMANDVERVAREIVDAAFKVHYELGPGLLESVYEECLCLIMHDKQLQVERQLEVPIAFCGKTLQTKLRLDLFVNRSVVVELKSVERMQPLYQAQLMTYMKLTGSRLGFLVNFNVPRIKQGIQRVAL